MQRELLMNIKELEELIENARANGATDNTKVRVFDLDHRIEADSFDFILDGNDGFIVISP